MEIIIELFTGNGRLKFAEKYFVNVAIQFVNVKPAN